MSQDKLTIDELTTAIEELTTASEVLFTTGKAHPTEALVLGALVLQSIIQLNILQELREQDEFLKNEEEENRNFCGGPVGAA